MPQTDLTAPASPSAAATTRVAIVGASGYAGQELVRLLARHPLARLTLATGSQASSAPRRLPALARIWDGEVVPLDLEAVGRGRGDRVPGAARSRVGRGGAAAARRRGAGHRSLGGVPSA